MAITSAAVLPVANYNGSRYFYFAVENRGVLSTFGGGCHPNEKPHKAGARELAEESLNAFGKFSSKDIKKSRHCTTGSHITYFLEADTHKFDPMDKFDRIRQRRFSRLTRAQKEIKEIIAVNKDTLIRELQNGNSSFQGHQLRQCLVASLTDALRKGILQKA
jgi:hypothetical protein